MVFENLKRKCKENGYSVCSLCDKLKISKSNATNWKNGGNPSIDVLIEISRILNCSIDYLLGVDLHSAYKLEQTFWNKFCLLSEIKGIKPHKAMKEMHFSSGTAHNWKNGSLPSGEALKTIATYFNVSANWLLDLENNITPLNTMEESI